MRRRDFLTLLASGLVGSHIDVDRLLWIPNTKTIFLPTLHRFTTSDIVAAEMARILPHITTIFEQDDVFYQAFKARGGTRVSSRSIRVPLDYGKKNIP